MAAKFEVLEKEHEELIEFQENYCLNVDNNKDNIVNMYRGEIDTLTTMVQ